MSKQKGKHFDGKTTKDPNKEESNNKKKSKKGWFVFFFLLLIALIVGAIMYYRENKEFVIENINKYVTQIIPNKDDKKGETEEAKAANMPDKMGEYNVLGLIVIDKLKLEKNILDKTTDEALNLSVTKFYGPELNEEGNLCITGHNYEELFAHLNELQLKDTFYIIDKANAKKVTYEIYDKYTVSPTDLDCLNQETQGKREVTLITCNPGGTTRLIIKAREK